MNSESTKPLKEIVLIEKGKRFFLFDVGFVYWLDDLSQNLKNYKVSSVSKSNLIGLIFKVSNFFNVFLSNPKLNPPFLEKLMSLDVDKEIFVYELFFPEALLLHFNCMVIIAEDMDVNDVKFIDKCYQVKVGDEAVLMIPEKKLSFMGDIEFWADEGDVEKCMICINSDRVFYFMNEEDKIRLSDYLINLLNRINVLCVESNMKPFKILK